MSRRKKKSVNNALHMDLVDVEALTDNQEVMLKSHKNVVANGAAGTGKTFLATYKAMKAILENKQYHKLIYIRSAVPTRDMGFLPGDDKAKAEIYKLPYKGIMNELFGRGDAYTVLEHKGVVEFLTTSYVRGTTLSNAIIIVDECQNMTYHELDSVITRVGEDCLVYFCGDMFQADLEKNGVKNFYSVLKKMGSFDFIEFKAEDIVRSDFVKEYLLTKYDVHGDKEKL